MRDSSEIDASTVATPWGASDALLLEGLSGLDQRFPKPQRLAKNEDTAEESATYSGLGERRFNEPSPEAPVTGFRSARELRAAQERVAALRRSAARRREGVTQALGLSSPPEAPGIGIHAAPSPKPITRPNAAGVPSSKAPSSEITRTSGDQATPIAPAIPPAMPGETATPKPSTSDAVPRTAIPAEPRPIKRRPIEPRQDSMIPLESEPRLVSTQMEPVVRRRRTSSSFLPAVLTALLLTSLVWGSLLYSAWRFVGQDWFTAQVQAAVNPVQGNLGEELKVGQASLTQDVRILEERLALFQANHQNFVRLNAIEASLYSGDSRQQFDDLLAIGQDLATGSPEEEFFKQTKTRIESAYSNRLTQQMTKHAGLDVGRLFPNVSARRDTEVDKDSLMRFINSDHKVSWDKARAAYLLRRFKNDDKVTAELIQTVLYGDDLNVVFAAWDSLIALTGYDPGAGGFQPDDFKRWFSTKPSE